jgi:hypothetical protein
MAHSEIGTSSQISEFVVQPDDRTAKQGEGHSPPGEPTKPSRDMAGRRKPGWRGPREAGFDEPSPDRRSVVLARPDQLYAAPEGHGIVVIGHSQGRAVIVDRITVPGRRRRFYTCADARHNHL